MQHDDDTVRYDDRLATVLQIDASTSSGRLAIWWQLTAMLGQSGNELSEPAAARALAAVALLSSAIPIDARTAAAKAMAARCNHAPLAVLFSRDAPQVVSALFDRLNLSKRDWSLILPDLTPLARSRLRSRSDLPVSVQRDLASVSSADFVLSASPEALNDVVNARSSATVQPTAQVGSPIAELVHRIEAYRNRKPANDGAQTAANSKTDTVNFATDADGYLRLVAASPRGMFVGVSLADIAHPGATGVDAGVAAAFGKRGHIIAGRLLLAGESRWSGLWAIHAQPHFDSLTGRFTGYRGTLSRDLGEAIIDPAQTPPLSGTADRQLASAMQQMTHELRSPLNAISGFAQLVAGQYFGPVAASYRDIATRIVADATFLTGAFDDIDLASRLDTGRFVAASDGNCDLARLLDMFQPDFRDVHHPPGAFPLAVSCADAHRLLRLVAKPSLQSPDTSPLRLEESIVTGAGIDLVFHGALYPSGDDGADEMSLDIARRLAAVLGCTITTSGRKVIVNLPRLLVGSDRADIAG